MIPRPPWQGPFVVRGGPLCYNSHWPRSHCGDSRNRKEVPMAQDQPKAPFTQAEPEKKSRRVAVLIGALVLAIAVLAYVVLKGPSGPTPSPKMRQMEETVQQIQQLESG